MHQCLFAIYESCYNGDMDENNSTASASTPPDASAEPISEAVVVTEAPTTETTATVSEAVPEAAPESVSTVEPAPEVIQETATPIIEQAVIDTPASVQGEIVQSAPAPTESQAPAPTRAVGSVGSEATPAQVKMEAEVSAPLPTLESEVRRSSVDEILHALSPAQIKAIVKKYLYARSIEGRASRDRHLVERKQLILKLIGERSRITRKEVMKLVSISRTGAKRYLNLLEKEGKIVQHGKIGPKVYYTLR